MVKIFVTLFILTYLFTSVILAQDATPSTNRREKVRERIEARKDKMATREAALKAKLEKFKDKRRAEIADRINTNLNNINQKQTAQMLKHLDKMSDLLDKLEARVTAKDVTAETRVKIGAAKISVQTQSEKDYTLTVTSESKVRTDAKKVRDELHQDLQVVRKQVVEAKQSVANAIRVAKSGKEATQSGQQ